MRYSDSYHTTGRWQPRASTEGFPMGVSIEVNGLTKSFGSSRIWEDVTLTI
ncbi:ABC transporter ATP-binding protein, partial [Klebsiella pneumoniae]